MRSLFIVDGVVDQFVVDVVDAVVLRIDEVIAIGSHFQGRRHAPREMNRFLRVFADIFEVLLSRLARLVGACELVRVGSLSLEVEVLDVGCVKIFLFHRYQVLQVRLVFVGFDGFALDVEGLEEHDR